MVPLFLFGRSNTYRGESSKVNKIGSRVFYHLTDLHRDSFLGLPSGGPFLFWENELGVSKWPSANGKSLVTKVEKFIKKVEVKVSAKTICLGWRYKMFHLRVEQLGKGWTTNRRHEFMSDLDRDYFYILDFSTGFFELNLLQCRQLRYVDSMISVYEIILNLHQKSGINKLVQKKLNKLMVQI
ncbi:hypothetical protein JZI27_20420 [Brevibacillus sp. AY1]|nr:hypothetical protein [Brevibacillus sp. AY1]MDH4619401.1 hypothetical protein [Brevibacillus sp. AY1]